MNFHSGGTFEYQVGVGYWVGYQGTFEYIILLSLGAGITAFQSKQIVYHSNTY